MAKEKTRGGVRSPMSGYEANESHRMPSTAGTTEMTDRKPSEQGAKVQTPQMPFKIKPMNGGSGKK